MDRKEAKNKIFKYLKQRILTRRNNVKNQHYITEALLCHFTNSDGGFFEALLDSKKIYPTNPRASMCERFIYEDEKLKINTVERYFSRIETEVVPLVKELIQLINKYKSNEVEFSEIKISINKTRSHCFQKRY